MSWLASALLFPWLQLSAVQVPVAAVATAPEPAGRRFVLDAPVPLHFEVPTNVGLVSGTVDVVRIDGVGIEGWGRFELRMTLDPATVNTGDPLRDRHIARVVLSGDAGVLHVASTDRLASLPAEGGGWILGASTWMDARRGRKHLDLRYLWTAKGDTATFSFSHEAALEDLGLNPPNHPFIQVTGPMKLSLRAPMVRPR